MHCIQFTFSQFHLLRLYNGTGVEWSTVPDYKASTSAQYMTVFRIKSTFENLPCSQRVHLNTIVCHKCHLSNIFKWNFSPYRGLLTLVGKKCTGCLIKSSVQVSKQYEGSLGIKRALKDDRGGMVAKGYVGSERPAWRPFPFLKPLYLLTSLPWYSGGTFLFIGLLVLWESVAKRRCARNVCISKHIPQKLCWLKACIAPDFSRRV